MTITIKDITTVIEAFRSALNGCDASLHAKATMQAHLRQVEQAFTDGPTIFVTKSKLYFKFQYDPTLVAVMKACKDFADQSIRFNPKRKTWSCKKSKATLEYAKLIADEYGFVFYNSFDEQPSEEDLKRAKQALVNYQSIGYRDDSSADAVAKFLRESEITKCPPGPKPKGQVIRRRRPKRRKGLNK